MPAPLHFPNKGYSAIHSNESATSAHKHRSIEANAQMNTSDTRNAVLAVIAEALQGIDESLYVVREYVKKRGLTDGVFTEADVKEFDSEDPEDPPFDPAQGPPPGEAAA